MIFKGGEVKNFFWKFLEQLFINQNCNRRDNLYSYEYYKLEK